jgi:hypothetical protein
MLNVMNKVGENQWNVVLDEALHYEVLSEWVCIDVMQHPRNCLPFFRP